MDVPSELQSASPVVIAQANRKLLDGKTNRPNLKAFQRVQWTVSYGNTTVSYDGIFVLWVIIVAMLCVAIVAGAVYYLDFSRLAGLEEDGMAILAKITDSRQETEREMIVSYRFEVDGQVYERSEEVPKEIYDLAEPGTSIRIKYDPDDPSFSRVVEGPNDSVYALRDKSPRGALITVIGLGITGLIVTLGGTKLLYKPVFVPWRQTAPLAARLKHDGRLRLGKVANHEKVESSDDSERIIIYYQFTNPEGNLITGKTAPLSLSTKKTDALLSPEAKVAVLYVDDKLHTVL